MLAPIAVQAPGAKLVTVLVATTRQRENANENVFASGQAPALNYAEFTISIPPRHEQGKIEWPDRRPDSATAFATVRQTVLDEKTFNARAASTVRGDRKRETRIFVHGYNTNFQEALFELAQLTADSDAPGVPILFAWPSEAAVTGYVADRDAVTFSRDHLVGLLTTLGREPRADRITLIGHSMGAWLAVEALRQLRLTGQTATLSRVNAVLASPDIDIDVFTQQMTVIGPLDPPMAILVSPDDRALRLSSRLSQERPRLGSLDVDDPRIQETARKLKLNIIDISKLKATDQFNHNRFSTLATLYGKLQKESGSGARSDEGGLRRIGAFVFDGIGQTLSSPFVLADRSQRGQ